MPTLMKPKEKLELAERLKQRIGNNKRYIRSSSCFENLAKEIVTNFALSDAYIKARDWHNFTYNTDSNLVLCVYNLLYDALIEEFPYSGYPEYIEATKDNRIYRGHYYHSNESSHNVTSILQYFKIYIDYPFIEKLVKAGIYLFLGSIISYSWESKTDVSTFMKRNFDPTGKSLKDIMKLPSYVASSETIRDVRDLTTWNELRIAVQKYIKSKEDWEAFSMLTNYHPSSWGSMIKKAKSLLNSGHYTLSGLINYLHRVDLYQAIRLDDAMQLLTDYISMCKQCDVKPDINTNSLKREHDVLQRNFWSLKANAREAEFAEIAEDFTKFEYSDNEFMIVAPKTAADVINEGVNQRNCVGAYVDRIIDKQTIIVFLRRKDNPEKSLVTIEISPETYSVRQQLMARNDHITSKKILDFIEKWQKKIGKKQP